jgi:hypothetical protein
MCESNFTSTFSPKQNASERNVTKPD